MDTLSPLKAILDSNKIENRIEINTYYDGTTSKYLVFMFPVARDFEEIRISENNQNINSIISSNFMKFRGISNYEAMWSNELRCIECGITVPGQVGPNRLLLRKLSKLLRLGDCIDSEDNTKQEELLSVTLYSSEKESVSIGYCSKEFLILHNNSTRRMHFGDIDKDVQRFPLTIKIENVSLKSQEDAKKELEKITNTLFYQLDLIYDLLVTLSPRMDRKKEQLNRRMSGRNGENSERRNLELTYEYDNIPMKLYWLAQSSVYSPIFRYFALYQVVEYYFPIYTEISIKTKMRNLIKDPIFNINKDEDLLQLLSLARNSNGGNIGDEREQLNITLRNILSGEDIIQFIQKNHALQSYYTDKNWKKLSEHKLRLSDNVGIIDDVSARIYDIRCKIVHNKASEVTNKILPMTKEVSLLEEEIELLEFIARKAIIANSHPYNHV